MMTTDDFHTVHNGVILIWPVPNVGQTFLFTPQMFCAFKKEV